MTFGKVASFFAVGATVEGMESKYTSRTTTAASRKKEVTYTKDDLDFAFSKHRQPKPKKLKERVIKLRPDDKKPYIKYMSMAKKKGIKKQWEYAVFKFLDEKYKKKLQRCIEDADNWPGFQTLWRKDKLNTYLMTDSFGKSTIKRYREVFDRWEYNVRHHTNLKICLDGKDKQHERQMKHQCDYIEPKNYNANQRQIKQTKCSKRLSKAANQQRIAKSKKRKENRKARKLNYYEKGYGQYHYKQDQ